MGETKLYATIGDDDSIDEYITDTALQAKLDMFTPESILATEKMLADIEKVYAYDNESDQGGMYDETEYKFTFKEKGAHGYEQEMYAGTEDGKWKVRLVDSPYSWAEPFYIEFRYN